MQHMAVPYIIYKNVQKEYRIYICVKSFHKINNLFEWGIKTESFKAIVS